MSILHRTGSALPILLIALASHTSTHADQTVHPITDSSPAHGSQGKIMLYGVIKEKPEAWLRVQSENDSRQTFEKAPYGPDASEDKTDIE